MVRKYRATVDMKDDGSMSLESTDIQDLKDASSQSNTLARIRITNESQPDVAPFNALVGSTGGNMFLVRTNELDYDFTDKLSWTATVSFTSSKEFTANTLLPTS